MIATLTGVVTEKLVYAIVLEASGVGYEVQIMAMDYGSLDCGEPAKLYIYENIRENNYDLFGFINKSDKFFFELLLSVNGVGPKMALSILNVGTGESLRSAIAAGETKYLQGASGVGKRVAERIVVDLKDKVGLSSPEGATDFLQGIAVADEAAEALVALGFSLPDALGALVGVDNKLPVAERVRMALREAGKVR